MVDSNPITFENFKNFSLAPGDWGIDPFNCKIPVMESVIKEFYSVLDSQIIPNKPVVIMRRNDGPQFNHFGDFDVIGLDTHDTYWAQFAYQFAHELCHHVIQSNWFALNSKFGWFEESICEMASIYVMRKMSVKWLTEPPYFSAQTFAPSLAKTAQFNMDRYEVDLNTPFQGWLSENLTDLENDRYIRNKNAVVAYNLLPVFTDDPELWKMIHYLKSISIGDEVTLDDFLTEWKNVLPENLKLKFKKLENVFYYRGI